VGRRAALLFLLTLLLGCGKESTISDQEPPPIPQFVPRGADTALVELGIDAVPMGITSRFPGSLRMLPMSGLPPLPPCRGFIGSRSARSGVGLGFGHSGYGFRVFLHGQQSDPFHDSSGGFFYWITAYDESGNESGLSEEAYFRLMPKADLQAPVVLGDTLSLSWNYTGQPFEVDYYVVRLFVLEGSVSNPIWLLKYDLYNLNPVDHIGMLEPGSYRYQVDVIGASPPDRPSGSEASYSFSHP